MAGYGWSTEAVSMLLDEYQKHTCLYALKSPLYHNRRARREAEMKICQVLHNLRPNTNVGEVKAKINALRTQFSSERNKILKCLESGENYKYSFTWYERMLFLNDYVSTRHRKVNNEYNQYTYKETQIQEESILGPYCSNSITLKCEREDELVEEEEEEEEELTSTRGCSLGTQEAASKSGATNKDRKRVYAEEAAELPPGDPDDDFCRFIINEMKSIKSKKLKMTVKHSIQKIIMDAQVEDLSD